ncbi:MAG: TonB-dependent receptor domain-containing protein [Chitinophagales bacterium]
MRKLLLVFSLLTCACLVQGQKTITGIIKDSRNSQPIPGVSVKLRGTKSGTVTSNNGAYRISANTGDVLEFTMIGFKSQVATIGSSTDISLSLEPGGAELAEIVFVGSRTPGRARLETPVPVDVIRVNQVGLPTAKMDLTSVLNFAAPSFNYNKQSGADGADHIDLGTLRGLGPDQTLVLINGKRRHQTAFVTLFGTRGRGNSGADLDAFPESSVDRLEILRDGASAQYGSDAIAGVINIILKKNVNHLSANVGWSGYYDNEFNTRKFNGGNQYYSGGAIDGNTLAVSLNDGFNIGKNGGFINISLDFRTLGKTYRQVDTANWESNKNATPYLNTSRRAFGDGSLTTVGGFFNMEIPTSASQKTTFYAFGGYNYKSSDAYAYSRNYSSKPDRFPVTSTGFLVNDPAIMRVTGDGETYYNPHIQTQITDASLAAGLRGETGSNWAWDLSNTIGSNNFHYFGDQTFNASNIGQISPTHFDDGGFTFLQNTLNLDFNKNFATVAKGFNLGLGAEYRYEKYTIYEGEFASYGSMNNNQPIIYQNLVGDGLADSLRTPATGSQGFPGFGPDDAKVANRSILGLYADGELTVTDKWLIDGAVRFENYSDFGFVSTFKFATRYRITPDLNFRGSISTGYRAPSLQQIYFSNTLTSFSAGELVQSRIADNKDPITRAAGIPDLVQETSVNASAGFSWKAAKGLTFTLDGYMVEVKNRIVLSGLFSKYDTTLPASFTNAVPPEVSTVQFFANAVSTTNWGLDIVADYAKTWGRKGFKALLAGNWQSMKVNEIHVPPALNGTTLNQKTFFSDREQAFLIASAPNVKFALSLEYDVNNIGIGTHMTYYGLIRLLGFGSATAENPNQTGINPQVPTDADPNVLVPEIFNYNPKLITDLWLSYKFSKNVSLFLGADNLFNVHPDLGVNPQAKGWAEDNESGGPWDSVQMGFNGLRLFTKLALNF